MNQSFSWKRTPEYKLLGWLTHEVARRTPPLLSPTRLPSRSAPPRTVRPEPRYHGPLSGGTALTPCDQGDVALRTALRPTHCLLASQCSPAGARSLWAATRELVSPPRASLLLCPRRLAKIVSVTCHFRYPGLPVALARLKRAALRLLCHRRAVALHASAIILLVTRDRRVCQAHQSVETLSPALSWDCASLDRPDLNPRSRHQHISTSRPAEMTRANVLGTLGRPAPFVMGRARRGGKGLQPPLTSQERSHSCLRACRGLMSSP